MKLIRAWRAHWLPWPWADALAKRLVEAAAGWGALVLAVWYISRSLQNLEVTHPGDLPGSSLAWLFPVLAALFVAIRGTFRAIYHPIRAAITGRFLDQEAVAGMPPYRGVPPTDAPPPASEPRTRHAHDVLD